MSEIAQSQDAARWERAQALYRVIERHVLGSVCCVVDAVALDAIADEIGLPKLAKNPYWLGFRTIVNATAHMQRQMGLSAPIDFVFDDKSEKARVMGAWDSYVASLPHDLRRLTGQPPVFRDDTLVLPLQAADFYAWWVRKWREGDGQVHGPVLRFPWRAKKNFPRLVMEWREDHLRAEMTKIYNELKYKFESGVQSANR